MKKLLLLLASLAAAGTCLAQTTPEFGLRAGYLLESGEMFYTGHVGIDLAQNGDRSHQAQFEIGYNKETDNGITAKITPFMGNYRFSGPISTGAQFFIGGGAGISRIKLSGFGLSDDNTAFTAQGFAGLALQPTPTVGVTAGVRYLWIDDVSLFGFRAEVGDDVSFEAGLRFRF